jgi:E3 ubiquitin-protein ligase RGLG
VKAIEDHFKSLQEVSEAIKSAGLENSQLIFGIDFTISNLENGTRTFNGRSLHFCDDDIKNPYQKVIEILGKTLECFDVDGRIPAFGFGDANTKDRKVFPFSSTGYCLGFKDVLAKYNEILRDVRLSGPTNFAPLIKESIKIVRETKQVCFFYININFF